MRMLIFLIQLAFYHAVYSQDLEMVLFERSKVMDSGVEIINVGESKFLISVGKAEFDPTNPKSKINSMRISHLKAEENANKFFSGTSISVSERFKEVSINGQVVNQSEVVLEERSAGETGVYKTLGNWVSLYLMYTSIYYLIE